MSNHKILEPPLNRKKILDSHGGEKSPPKSSDIERLAAYRIDAELRVFPMAWEAAHA